jgi:hypothetical protein
VLQAGRSGIRFPIDTAIELRPSKSIVLPLVNYRFVNPAFRIKSRTFLMGRHGSHLVP